MPDLDQILDGLTVDLQPFAICEARGDAVIDLGARSHATMHYVLSGSGTFAMAGQPDIRSDNGMIVIAPTQLEHQLRAEANTKCETLRCAPLDPHWQLHQAGEGRAGIIVACSEIVVSYREIEGIFNYLQEPLVCRISKADPLKSALEQILNELATPKAGGRMLVRALMQQCMIHILRQYAANSPLEIQWLAAAHDERLWRAVTAIFDAPEAPHTLEGLSDIAQMSRSAFAERFKQAFGRGPIDLLKQTRLQRAARLLAASDLSIKAIVRATGYVSRSYFSRAFHAFYGKSPVDYRRDCQLKSVL